MPNFQRILHPTDFSQPAAQAFLVARTLARDNAAKLILLHVAQQPAISNVAGLPVPPPPPLSIDINGLKAQLDAIAAANPQLRIESHVVEGQPSSAILDVAHELNCDMIVIGSHGRTGLNRLLMGSIAEQLVRRATCPVLTVKTPLIQPPKEHPASE
jgi:nucleotide-binding universal stress UspA family protein